MNKLQIQNLDIDSEYSDNILTLPTDKIQPTEIETQLTDTLFKQQKSIFKKIFSTGIQELILMTLLFMIFSVPDINDMVISKIPVSLTKNPYIFVLLKTIIFIFIFYILKTRFLS